MARSSTRFVFLFLLIVLTGNAAFGQTNRYMVHLSDKNGSDYSIDNPEAFLSQRALDRRAGVGADITVQDLPVNSSYINNLKATGAEVFFTSKWLNAALVQCDLSLVEDIAALSFVDSVEYVAPGAKLTSTTSNKPKNTGSKPARKQRTKQEASEFQNSMLGVDALHEAGITGEGVLIAVMDGGYEGVNEVSAFAHLYQEGRIRYTYDYVKSGSDVYRYSDHGTEVFSLLGAYDEGVFKGSAFDADYLLFVTEDDCFSCEHRVEEYNWVFAAESADSAGADILNTSLGYNLFVDRSMSYTQEQMDGNTAIISRAADIAYEKGMLVVAAAGNEARNGWGIVTAPADAFNVISVGSITSDGERSASSSLGPTADQRMKPELVALGSTVQVISSSGTVTGGLGTSYSSPQVAGLAALLLQAYPELTTHDIRFLMMETASNSSNPDNEIGYGIPNYFSLNNYLNFSESEKAIVLYPNPVDDNKVLIRVNNPAENPVLNVTILNTNGQKLMKTSINFTWQNNVHTIDISSLQAGLYFFEINSGQKIERIRIVKS